MVAGTETRSVLFTDVVGSTELRVRLGEDEADSVGQRHHDVVCVTVAESGGTVVKNLGDGIMATFGGAAEAVAAAVAVQQAAEEFSRSHPEGELRLRIGISVGDVSRDGDDVFGTPVVEASRLCAAAGAGQIFVADLVRAMARGRGGHVFEPIGNLELKGLSEPVAACQVMWEPLAPDAGPVPFPPLLLLGAATAFVGRDGTRDRLAEAWSGSRAGSPRCVLLAGEPGIGKTRTAGEVARDAYDNGAVVLFGRCPEGIASPYQPFVEALDWYVRHAPEPKLGRLGGELTRLSPELAAMIPGEAAIASDPRAEEFRLFEAVASWLVDASEPGGLVLILDDLHWAPKPSLQLLVHVLREAAAESGRLLVLGTYRDTDVDRSHPLSAVLADLRRLPGVERVPLDGLDEAGTVALVASAAGHELDDGARQLALAVHAETDGNPFFAGEVLRHLVESGAVRRTGDRWVVGSAEGVTVPESVRDVIGRRLTRLSEDANAVLAHAAVIGRDVDVDVLIAVSGLGEDAVLDALDEASRARLVEETAAGHIRFAHALVRATLYEELSATRRRRLHRDALVAIEKLHPDDVESLAHHALEAGGDETAQRRAVDYALAAADRALVARAVSEAEARYSRVLAAIDDIGLDAEDAVIDSLIGLGVCQRDLGDPAYRQTLLDAASRADAIGDGPRMLTAVIENHRGVASTVGAVDHERIAAIERSLERLDETDAVGRAKAIAQLAAERTFTGDNARRIELAAEAQRLAADTGDERLACWVAARVGYAALDAMEVEAYIGHYRRQHDVSVKLGDDALTFTHSVWVTGAALVLGDVASVREQQALRMRLAGDLPPTYRWMALASDALVRYLDGDVVGADEVANEAFAYGQETGQPDALWWWGSTTAGILSARGTLGDLADTMGTIVQEVPEAVIWRIGHAWGLSAAGRSDEARAVLADASFEAEATLAEPYPLLAPGQLAHIAFHLGDRDLARVAYRLLQPAAQRNLWAHYWLFTLGPVRALAGLCSFVLGEHDRALLELDEARTSAAAAGAVGPATTIGFDVARALAARDAPGDRDRLSRLVDELLPVADAWRAPARRAELESLVAP